MAAGSHGWRVPPPAPEQLIRWPEERGARFVVFVDTEEEFDWSAPFARGARSVTAIAALPDRHQRFAERGVFPCYLCDYPVVVDEASAAILKAMVADGSGSIGAQLHAWVNPPHDEIVSVHSSYAGNLPVALEAAKIDALTSAITTAFGQAPVAFRSGRYGLGRNTLRLLHARGYRLDTTMRARHDYRPAGGPDFSLIGPDAFRTGSGGAIVEVPLTTVYTGTLRRVGRPLHRLAGAAPRGRGVLARTGLLSRVPLTPEGVPIAEACEAVRVAVGEGRRLLNFAFHSPSLVPGNTPYVRDAGDLARFHRWWDVMLDLLDELGVASTTPEILIADVQQMAGR
ncbi:WalW protein [Sphingomonas sp. NBWT7]|uniref:polysaccharide deacetylase family protein n=1 Tax=Sphingomonas sp. NBWT7 TaxID=2596913 RepID=UPI0016254340|nr:polysaccharide deacetylase family protein [Sphingomonas sp. NBWT7]QNE31457.1 WalW protein [Sphingomonas sp. NBWT7]